MLRLINITLNILLNFFDPQIKYLLYNLNNKSLSINITDINLIINIKIKNYKIYLNNKVNKNIVKGHLIYILECILNKNLQTLIKTKKLYYNGSLKDLNNFNIFLNAIKIDFYCKLSKLINPIFFIIIFKIFQKIKEYFKILKKELFIDIKDFLIEEKKILISKNEINNFYYEVQKLKQDINKIKIKIIKRKLI